VKKLRKRSDHSLENYRQLVEEDTDTSRVYVNELLGKVQNRTVERELLPMYSLAFATGDGKTYAETAFLPQVEKLNRGRGDMPRLIFTATERRDARTDDEKTGDLLVEIGKRLEKDANCDLLLVRSVVLRDMYNYPAALADVEQILRTDTANSLACWQRATLLMDMAQATSHQAEGQKNEASAMQLELALRDAERALALAPQNAYALYNRGCVLARLGRTQAAIDDFTRAIAADGRLPEAYYNRAVLYMRAGDYKKAIPDLSRAGELGLYRAYNLLKQASADAEEKKTGTD